MTPVSLAFVGDAVHTLFVRQSVLSSHDYTINQYNKYCSKYCSAKWQSTILDKILPVLNEDEQDIVRRARNFKTNNVAKNASIEEYKKATSFEALIGYLHLKQQTERLNQFLKISLVEGEDKW